MSSAVPETVSCKEYCNSDATTFTIADGISDSMPAQIIEEPLSYNSQMYLYEKFVNCAMMRQKT